MAPYGVSGFLGISLGGIILGYTLVLVVAFHIAASYLKLFLMGGKEH